MKKTGKKKKVKVNTGRLTLVIVVVIALIAAAVLGAKLYGKYKVQQNYKNAVSYIAAEKFEDASKLLEDMDYKDSAVLLSYCQLQNNLSTYKSDVTGFEEKLKGLSGIQSSTVQDQIDDAVKELDKVIAVQALIDDLPEDQLPKQADIDKIKKKLLDISSRYFTFIDQTKYDQCVETLSNISDDTDAGKTMTAIRKIGTVTLKSESLITKARTLYDKLSKSDQKLIVNYEDLEKAEKKLAKLQAAQAKKEAAEAKKKAEAKAAAAKKKAAAKKAAAAKKKAASKKNN